MAHKLFLLLTVLLILVCLPALAVAQKSCFTAEARELAERTARVFREPDPGYNPVLGFNPAQGPRRGAPPVDANGRARAFTCVANRDLTPGAGTTPKFHCSVPGIVDERRSDSIQSETAFQGPGAGQEER